MQSFKKVLKKFIFPYIPLMVLGARPKIRLVRLIRNFRGAPRVAERKPKQGVRIAQVGRKQILLTWPFAKTKFSTLTLVP